MKESTTEKINRIVQQASLQAKKEVFDDIDEVFKLNDTQAIKLYAKCGCCSRFVKKLLEVKERQLNTSNTDSKNKEDD